MKSDSKWDTLDPRERRIAELLVQGKSNAAICAEVFLSRTRVQECIKRILIKTGADSTRGAIALLVRERETLSLLRVLEQATDGVIIIQDRLVKFTNTAMERMHGYEPNEMVGMPFLELIAPESRDIMSKRYELRVQGEPVPASYAIRILCKGGQEKDAIITSGGQIGYCGRPAVLGIEAHHLSEE